MTNNNTTTNEYTCEYCGCVLTEEEVRETAGHIHCEDCESYLVVCDCCGEPVDTREASSYTTENREEVCEDCLYDYFTECYECGDYVRNGDIVEATGYYGQEVHVCRHCADNYYVECADCGEIFHQDVVTYDEYEGEYYCEDCCNKRNVINNYGYKPTPVFYGDDDLYMGVELEIDNPDGGDRCVNQHRDFFITKGEKNMEIKGYITNLEDYNAGRLNGEWIEFPIDEYELEEVLERIGCADGTEYFFTDWESDILSPSDLGEFIRPEEVNDIYDALEEWGEDALNAALEVFGLNYIVNASPDDFFFAPDIVTDEDLGYYYADECDIFCNASDTLERYFDHEAYGRDIRLESDGALTLYGWIERIS